jgi:hypothetical protein
VNGIGWGVRAYCWQWGGRNNENLPKEAKEESACHTILHLCGREYYKMSRKGSGCSHAGKVHGGIEQAGGLEESVAIEKCM